MKEQIFVISGYGRPGEADLKVYRIRGTKAPELISAVCHGRRPSFLCCGAENVIYAASERSDGADISAYRLVEGQLLLMRTMEVPGRGLCHLYEREGVIFGSCYESGDYFAVDAGLTKVLWRWRPAGAHAHWAESCRDVLYLADLGNDRIYRFALEGKLPAGEPEVWEQPAGSGPRQVMDRGDGSLICIYELDAMVRRLDENGAVLEARRADEKVLEGQDNWPGGACMDDGGRIFVCNRGPDTISVFAPSGAQLCDSGRWQTGCWPRQIAFCQEPKLLLAACTRADAVYAYLLEGGRAREAFRLELPGASCALFLHN